MPEDSSHEGSEGRDGRDENELETREAARVRRRDRDADAEARALMRPGMGKVFKQIQDAQAKAAKQRPKRRRGLRPGRPA